MLFQRFKRIRACRIIVLALALAWLPENNLHARSAVMKEEINNQSVLQLTVKSSPTAMFEDHDKLKDADIINAVNSPKWQVSDEVPRFSDLYISGERTAAQPFRVDISGRLWDVTQSKMLVLPDKAAAKLKQSADALRARHYGQLLDWQDAEKLFSRKAYFVIKDMETGLSFRVQRRAGHDHADVQPVTKEEGGGIRKIVPKLSRCLVNH